jgi:hypothetical protein
VARDKEEGGEYQFVPPDFDEDAFIHREMVHFKVTVGYFVWALLATGATFAAFLLLKGNPKAAWPAGIGIAIAFGLAFKPVMARFADVAIFKRNDWVWKYFQFGLTWLALATIALNPPITDVSPPEVMLSADPNLQAAGQAVVLTLVASDNDRLAGPPTVRLLRDGAPVAVEVPPTAERGVYSIPVTGLAAGRYTVTAVAQDGRGLLANATASFNVTGGELVAVRLPPGGNLTGEEQVTAKVQAKVCEGPPFRTPCVRSVFFNPVGCAASACTVPFHYEKDLDRWRAGANYAGWKEGANNGTVRAEFMDYHMGRNPDGTLRKIDAGMLSSGPVTIHVQVPLGVDPFKVTQLPEATPPPAMAPSWGAVAILAVLVGGAALLRRRVE